MLLLFEHGIKAGFGNPSVKLYIPNGMESLYNMYLE